MENLEASSARRTMTVPSRMSRASVCITGLMLLILASEAEGVMPNRDLLGTERVL